ncbi:hypothetical protein [Olleya namhaensis]|uniref:hypothetical protein n=1 Tax=Olleya namhaensis TaxID=1144750 RepID=UPI00232C5370|nr:hypothetical protein [Olleya namhaensis]
MKKLKNLGKALSKAEQKTVIGGIHHSQMPGGSGPGDVCMCYDILYMDRDGRSIAYGWAAIMPTPDCCLL